MPTQSLSIFQKLLEIRKAVPYLKKDTSGYQFDYVSSSQTLGALREKMDEMGVLLIPRVIRVRVSDHTTSKGNQEYFTEIWMHFTWINAEDPTQTIKCPWYGQGLDSGEKGVGKAATYAEKYFLLKFFNVATDKDDPDANQGNEKPKSKPSKPNTQQPEKKVPQKQGSGIPMTEKQGKAIFAIGKNDYDMSSEEIKAFKKWALGDNPVVGDASDLIKNFADKHAAWVASLGEPPINESVLPEDDDIPF